MSSTTDLLVWSTLPLIAWTLPLVARRWFRLSLHRHERRVAGRREVGASRRQDNALLREQSRRLHRLAAAKTAGRAFRELSQLIAPGQRTIPVALLHRDGHVRWSHRIPKGVPPCPSSDLLRTHLPRCEAACIDHADWRESDWLRECWPHRLPGPLVTLPILTDDPQQPDILVIGPLEREPEEIALHLADDCRPTLGELWADQCREATPDEEDWLTAVRSAASADVPAETTQLSLMVGQILSSLARRIPQTSISFYLRGTSDEWTCIARTQSSDASPIAEARQQVERQLLDVSGPDIVILEDRQALREVGIDRLIASAVLCSKELPDRSIASALLLTRPRPWRPSQADAALCQDALACLAALLENSLGCLAISSDAAQHEAVSASGR